VGSGIKFDSTEYAKYVKKVTLGFGRDKKGKYWPYEVGFLE
jgi:hypothetical protein